MERPPARDARPAKVLVVDDDDAVRALIARALAREGIAVAGAPDVETGLAAARSELPDLVLLDVMLPGASGFDALPRFRALGLPVILVSGRQEVTDRVLGLELGADDYVVKPFDPRELASRVRAVLRRVEHQAAGGAHDEPLSYDDLTIDPRARRVAVRGRPVELTAREFDLLAYLTARPHEVCTHDDLLEHVWHSSPEWQGPATVTEHVRRIRQKIEADPTRPVWIRTVRGVGYVFEP